MRRFFTSATIVSLRVFALVAMVATVSFVMVGCGSDDADTPSTNYPNGIKIVGDIDKEVNSGENIVTKTVMTEAGYTTSCDVDWITVTSNATSNKAGSFAIKMTVKQNNTGKTREAPVYITVSGHTTVKLANIVQLSMGTNDPVVQYVDERLQKEYLWMDEYIEKRPTFNFSQKYDRFITNSLLSLTTNIEDGGYDGYGDRYLFTNMSYLGTSSPFASASATRAGAQVRGLGIDLSVNSIRMGSGQNVALPIAHIFPGSPAEQAGLERGDWIVAYKGQDVTVNNYYNIWNEIMYGNPGTCELSWRTAFSQNEDSATVSMGTYDPSPIANASILDLSKYPAFEGKKVGYLAYTGFEYEYRQELVDAFNLFKQEGITDLVIDLTTNGGGEVYTSNYLVSMILNESYVGEFLGDMRRHPNNKAGDTNMYVTDETNNSAPIKLPHLRLTKVYFLVTNSTASASEATIAGLDGFDIETVLVGAPFTHGKNCGMDTETLKLGNGWYTFAPITFRIYNAKGWNDYADGLPSDIDVNSLAGETIATQKDMMFYYFPIPVGKWDDPVFNAPLHAALAHMIGKDAKTDNIFTTGSTISSTRSEAMQLGTPMAPIVDPHKEAKGMYVNKEDIERAKQQ